MISTVSNELIGTNKFYWRKSVSPKDFKDRELFQIVTFYDKRLVEMTMKNYAISIKSKGEFFSFLLNKFTKANF